MTNEKKIIAYKGFDKDFKCRDFQYEVGKTYEMDGNIECCNRGFHACESPIEVFDHYDMLTSRFAEVEQSGEIDKEDNSTKICSSRIKIKAELKLADIINLGVERLKEITAPSKIKANNSSNDGDYAQIGSSGKYAQIDSSGQNSVVMCAGCDSKAKAAIGSWITLAEWKRIGDMWKPICVKTEQVDGSRIKADTYYKLINGKFEEVE
jgi:hypothetical protein